ncbi:LysR substrate-binding domain-containing protein [Alloalcanivorax xenomutans]|uniref:LysR substrate-binding domain-containing protein n=1 Tax=Alloalcanivorax xenomutans TaxID=1094342 RepID=UPI0009B68688|nr:LysR substrate-binding domain-containing protein [Alloalcanivorax xenomutans]MCE7522039.1 LysR substrate-binding domain-containing protein [Alloalcanivorax xenomutans]
MKRRHLPPLNPVRSFEAAARNGSFTKAAEELHVTTVAVSRQVAVLEQYFGVPLFERRHQSLKLTREGREFLPYATAAFDQLYQGAQGLRSPESRPIVVCAYASIAIHWLIPRLCRFREAFPEIHIDLTTAAKPEEFDYDSIDVAIQYLKVSSQDLSSQTLLPDIIQPACSPGLLQGDYPIPPEENLPRHTFLHSKYRKQDWGEWLKTAKLSHLQPAHELTFKGSSLAYQAAAEGVGVAVVQRPLVDDEFRAGRLVAPFALAHQRSDGIVMAGRKRNFQHPQVSAFCDWLEQEARDSVKRMDIEYSRKDSSLLTVA